MLTTPRQKRIENRVMGQQKIRHGAIAVLLMSGVCPALAVEDVEPGDFAIEQTDNSAVPAPSDFTAATVPEDRS